MPRPKPAPGRPPLRSLALALVVACGTPAAMQSATPPAASGAPADLSSGFAPMPSGSGTAAIPTNAWQVSLFEKFARPGATPTSVELWPTLEHAWDDPCGPGAVVAQRKLCLPKGKYVFESRSSDHVRVKIDGEPVTTPRVELARTIDAITTELSRPRELDGCVLVRADMKNAGCFPGSRIKLTWREALNVAPCDENDFPKTGWNVCIFAGRQREELTQKESWKELVSPWPQGGGPKGWEGNFSLEARTTACFDAGKYVFQVKAPPVRLALYLDDNLLIDPQTKGPHDLVSSPPTELSGCHRLHARYVAFDDNTSFEVRWARVGSVTEKKWVQQADSCDPHCTEGAVCTRGASFGADRRVCLPRGRPGRMGEACTIGQRCDRGHEIECCRNDRLEGLRCGDAVTGVCTYRGD